MRDFVRNLYMNVTERSRSWYRVLDFVEDINLELGGKESNVEK